MEAIDDAHGVTETHWWRFAIIVQNDFRNSHARLEFNWYSAFATNFEAALVAGPPSTRTSARIRVYFNGILVGEYRDKASAMEQIRALVRRAPPACSALTEQHADVLLRALGVQNS